MLSNTELGWKREVYEYSGFTLAAVLTMYVDASLYFFFTLLVLGFISSVVIVCIERSLTNLFKDDQFSSYAKFYFKSSSWCDAYSFLMAMTTENSNI